MKFRKKPVIIEAFKWDGENVVELTTWATHSDLTCRKERGEIPQSGEISMPIHLISEGGGKFRLEIDTLEGVMHASVGDWIIQGVMGEFYPCREEIFAKTYEAVP